MPYPQELLDMDTTQQSIAKEAISGTDMFLKNTEFGRLESSYIILVARILSDMKPFAWMKTVIPTHIHHSYSASMSHRNEVFNLSIIHKNEAKYEDCLNIMDTIENCLQQVYTEAHGGDQLTKVRFDGAATLRLLSPTAAGTLDHIKSHFCELCHLKQDFFRKVKDLSKNSQDKKDDELYNYCCNSCTWGLHLVQLDELVKECDITIIIPNLKLCLPFLFSHSNRSKYLEQAIDYICQTQYLLSPLNKIRVLEGSFINLKGGIGNNIEADLVQEHSVREQKVLIKGLGANKPENAISVVTAAASAVTRICNHFDDTFSVSKVSTRHTSKASQKDHEIVQEVLRRIHPFKFQSGRMCAGFLALKSNQCKQIDLNCMLSDYEQLLERILQGHITIPEVDEDAVLSSNEEEIPELP
ncbi:hypothetical protein KUTeg_021581 [Tegillarca granosa]|uniref:DUF6589 domain-containing protein n=1 Tax=Tegillarca granosa TaxID=220873 RepID=A0ABQ9E849_TEGGR|nr:hypothetical protein KUTeg_021581 [Tegillarca granosa]